MITNYNMLKYLVENQARTFRELEKVSAKAEKSIKDPYFTGKKFAYGLAAEALEDLLKNYCDEE